MAGTTTGTADAEFAACLDANRAALQAKWAVDPCAGLPAGRPRDVGNPTLEPFRFQNPSGEWRTVHDAQYPLDEARGWLRQSLAQANGVVPATACVIGAGAGWIVDALEERSGETKILVLEPEPALAATMLARRDYRPLIEAGRLMVLAGPGFDGGAAAWRLFGRCIAEPLLLIHPIIAAARRDAAVAAARLMRHALADAAANEQARRRFAAPYLLNTLGNLPMMARESDAAALFGLAPGRPMVVAGAGPSLNRNLEELRPVRDRVVFIAADTALRPCLAAGLAPDFVVAVDPGAANARHLTGLPACDATALVAEPSLRGAAFAQFAGRTFLFRVARHHPWPWLASHGLEVTTLRAWGSVLITAFDLAVRLGGDPLILIGADLAYTDGQPYCRGTVYEQDWTTWQAEGQSLADIWRGAIAMHPAVTERLGDEVIATAPHLVQFRDGLLEAGRTAGRRVVNATGRGILRGPGLEQQGIVAAVGAAAPIALPALPRVPQPLAAVARIREALAGQGEPGRDGGFDAEWAAVFSQHEPPDPGLAGELSRTMADLAAWARVGQAD